MQSRGFGWGGWGRVVGGFGSLVFCSSCGLGGWWLVLIEERELGRSGWVVCCYD